MGQQIPAIPCRCEAHGRAEQRPLHNVPNLLTAIVREEAPVSPAWDNHKGGDLYLCRSCAALYANLDYHVGAVEGA